jgi:hypothetical protein
VTEELRGRLRDELAAERPPPLGDLVATALRDGRRIRRQRRWAALGGGTAVTGLLAVTVALGGPWGRLAAAPAPGSSDRPAQAVPAPGRSDRPAPPVPAPGAEDRPPRAVLPARPARPPSGGVVTFPPVPAPPSAPVTGPGQVRATPEAMLVLLEELLPPGRTSEHASTGPRELQVRLYLDRGEGPGMIRVSVGGDAAPGPRPGTPAVSVDSRPGNCIGSTVVRARWPGGLVVQADVAGCLAVDGRRTEPAPPVLSREEARVVVSDPRWGPAMDAALVRAGAQRFPQVAHFS